MNFRPEPAREAAQLREASDCPWCGEWRDAPSGDCANCGYAPRPCGDQMGICVYAGPHDGPHKFGAPVIEHLRAALATPTPEPLDVERLARAFKIVRLTHEIPNEPSDDLAALIAREYARLSTEPSAES